MQLPDGGWLVVEMSPERGCITRISSGRHSARASSEDRAGPTDSRVIAMAGSGSRRRPARPAQAVSTDGPGRACAAVSRRAVPVPERPRVRAERRPVPDGLRHPGRELAPGGELNPDWRSLRYDGRVYRIDSQDRRRSSCSTVACSSRTASRSVRTSGLYVTETLTGNIYRYAWRDGRCRGTARDVRQRHRALRPAELKGPDGMKFGADGQPLRRRVRPGRHHGARPRRRRRRAHQGRGHAPDQPAFGPRGEKQIYVTEVSTSSVQVYDVPCDGAPLYG